MVTQFENLKIEWNINSDLFLFWGNNAIKNQHQTYEGRFENRETISEGKNFTLYKYFLPTVICLAYAKLFETNSNLLIDTHALKFYLFL